MKFLDRIAQPRGILLIGLAWLVVFGAILFAIRQIAEVSGGSSILDFEVGYSPETVDDILGSYGEAGMALYRRVQLLDLFNPALYSLFLASLTRIVWRGTGDERIAYVALLGGIGDYLENITLFLIVAAYPEIDSKLVGLSSSLSLLKNGLLVLSVLPLFAGILRRSGHPGRP